MKRKNLMKHKRIAKAALIAWLGFCFWGRAAAAPQAPLAKRWLFVWRNMSDPKEVDRLIARFPRMQSDGYNGAVFGANVAPQKAPALRDAAQKYGVALIAIVMGGNPDRNYAEGVLAKDALFIANNGAATFQPDNPTATENTNFEDATGNHFNHWAFQDDEGVTTFADHSVTHRGKTALRMQDIGRNPARHCRIMQSIKLQPHRQYRVSFWVKTENMTPADPTAQILTADASASINFQTFHADATQDWKRYDLVFNSREYHDALLYLGSWNGKSGKVWWDDVEIQEIGLVNVLRRPGCPVTVRGENGAVYVEGRDYAPVSDPNLHPWVAYHAAPALRLTPGTRIKAGERLRVSYYHSILVYEDRLDYCLSEPKIFQNWRDEVKRVNDLLRPAAFLMSHDEIRVANQCALCQSKNMTAGELVAWNVRRAAQIIRDIRPDAGIWVWSDMFDPTHNAQDHYFAVNGSLKGAWKGLDKDVGIMNWNGEAQGRNCRFFSDLGLKQMLSGYYDNDDSGAGIAGWLAGVKAILGVEGAMYTTWEDRYDAMDAWAQRAWGGKAAESGR